MPDWTSFDARAQLLTAREEAILIRHLAAERAKAADQHATTCDCVPCRTRHWTRVQLDAAASYNRQLARRGTR